MTIDRNSAEVISLEKAVQYTHSFQRKNPDAICPQLSELIEMPGEIEVPGGTEGPGESEGSGGVKQEE